MDLEKRKLKSKLINEKKKESNHSRINKVFEKQTKKIREIQNSLAKRQNIMALEALHKYSAYKIQGIWRSFLAQKVLHGLRQERFIKGWYRFRRYMKVRYKAARDIVYRIQEYIRRKKFNHLQMCIRAARLIQKRLEICVSIRRYKIQLARNKFSRQQVNHILLFAKTRATSRITLSLEYGRKVKALSVMFSTYGRRKRLEMLRGLFMEIA